MKSIVAIICLLSTTYLSSTIVAQNSNARSDFLASYQAALERQRDRFINNHKFTIYETLFNEEDGSVINKREHQVIASNTCVICKTITLVKSKRENGKLRGETVEDSRPVWGLVRPDGYFRIEKSLDSDSYILSQMVKNPSDQFISHQYPFTLIFNGMKISDIVSNKGSTFVGISQKPWEGMSLSCITINDTFGSNKLRTRNIYMDDKSDWILHAIEYRLPDRVVTERVRYSGDDLKNRMPVSVEQSALLTGASRPIRLSVIDYSDYSQTGNSRNDFSLLQFGLPDPAGTDYASKSSHIYLLLFGVAIIFGIATIYTMRRRAKNVKPNMG